jgi:hypothetical protein
MLPSPAIKISGNYLASTRLPVTASDRFTMILFFSFAEVALVLAGVGIDGVMAFTVAQARTRDRPAHGSRRQLRQLGQPHSQ